VFDTKFVWTKEDFMTEEQQMTHKYAIVVDGNGVADRFARQMVCSSVF